MNKTTLITELKKAYEISSHYEGGYSGEFMDAKDFSKALKETIQLFESGNDACIKKLWLWFAPATAWDDFVGVEGEELGNSIFEKLGHYMEVNKIEI